MSRRQLILPTADIVGVYERKIAMVSNVLLSDTLKPYEPLYTAMQYLEYDDKNAIAEYADKLFDRALDITDDRVTASIFAQTAYDFGNKYHGVLTKLDLYEPPPDNQNKRFFPYYFGGCLGGDIIVRPYQ